MNDEKPKPKFKDPRLPNPVINPDLAKQFWANKIKAVNKTVKAGK